MKPAPSNDQLVDFAEKYFRIAKDRPVDSLERLERLLRDIEQYEPCQLSKQIASAVHDLSEAIKAGG